MTQYLYHPDAEAEEAAAATLVILARPLTDGAALR